MTVVIQEILLHDSRDTPIASPGKNNVLPVLTSNCCDFPRAGDVPAPAVQQQPHAQPVAAPCLLPAAAPHDELADAGDDDRVLPATAHLVTAAAATYPVLPAVHGALPAPAPAAAARHVELTAAAAAAAAGGDVVPAAGDDVQPAAGPADLAAARHDVAAEPGHHDVAERGSDDGGASWRPERPDDGSGDAHGSIPATVPSR